MTTDEIYSAIISAIEAILPNLTGEVDIVRKSVDEINNINWSPNIKIQSGFCHQKPYAFFITPERLFTKKKTELGDLLFVIKYLDNNTIIDKRALFFQAKYNQNGKPFLIELHQFHFYKQIERIEFKFGNRVYRDLSMEPIIWKTISQKNQFGDYLLISNRFAIDLFTNDIANQYEHKTNGHFRFDINSICDCRHFRLRHHELCYKFNSPLFDFITPFGKGNKIEGEFEAFISLIYKRLGMIPDPPEEHEGFWEESSNGGFGLIEITIDNNENIKG